MPSREAAGGYVASALDILLAPLRIPDRVVYALGSLGEALRELGPMHAELTRVREQTEPLVDLIPALEQILEHTARVPEMLSVVERISGHTELLAQLLSAVEHVEAGLGERIEGLHADVSSLEGEDSYLNKTVAELVGDLRAMHETLTGLKGDVRSLTDRMPDPNRGPLEKARDAFTSNSHRR